MQVVVPSINVNIVVVRVGEMDRYFGPFQLTTVPRVGEEVSVQDYDDELLFGRVSNVTWSLVVDEPDRAVVNVYLETETK